MGDVVECVGGSTPSTNELEYWDGGEYFWATPKDLSSMSEPFLLDTAKRSPLMGFSAFRRAFFLLEPFFSHQEHRLVTLLLLVFSSQSIRGLLL